MFGSGGCDRIWKPACVLHCHCHRACIRSPEHVLWHNSTLSAPGIWEAPVQTLHIWYIEIFIKFCNYLVEKFKAMHFSNMSTWVILQWDLVDNYFTIRVTHHLGHRQRSFLDFWFDWFKISAFTAVRSLRLQFHLNWKLLHLHPHGQEKRVAD